MYRSVEIDFLILCLRRKLDEVDGAIAELEREARAKRIPSSVRRPPAREKVEPRGVAGVWTCRRAG